MKYFYLLVIAALLASSGVQASTTQELWEKTAKRDEKQVVLTALYALQEAVREYTFPRFAQARKAGAVALKVCAYSNPEKKEGKGTVYNPNAACYRAINKAFDKFGGTLTVYRPEMPVFVERMDPKLPSGLAAPKQEAPPVPEPVRQPAKSISVGSSSSDKSSAMPGNKHIINVPQEE